MTKSDALPLGIETQLVHAGDPEPRILGSATVPVFQSTVYEVQPDHDGYSNLRYPRLSNLPNHQALQRKLATLEDGEDAVLTASGMSVIALALLSVLREGDHVLLQRGVYGGTHGFVTKELPNYGIAYDLIDAQQPSTWRAKLQENTKAIYVESISNPLMRVADLESTVAFAQEHSLTSLIDSTFTTPVYFRPLQMGFDVSLHSATKYLNGHSDVIAGAASGSEATISRIRERLLYHGGCLDAHACYLLDRGLRTLALRIRQQSKSALAIARFLSGREEVARVHYPGLPEHPDHARAERLFTGFGGMLAFELRDASQVAPLLAGLRLALHAPSLGGVETLVIRPARTSHAGLPPEEREALGVTDGLVRLSVGIERTTDLLADMEQALNGLR